MDYFFVDKLFKPCRGVKIVCKDTLLDYLASLTRFTLPIDHQLAEYSRISRQNNIKKRGRMDATWTAVGYQNSLFGVQ
jgi:hypothetical protein